MSICILFPCIACTYFRSSERLFVALNTICLWILFCHSNGKIMTIIQVNYRCIFCKDRMEYITNTHIITFNISWYIQDANSLLPRGHLGIRRFNIRYIHINIYIYIPLVWVNSGVGCCDFAPPLPSAPPNKDNLPAHEGAET